MKKNLLPIVALIALVGLVIIGCTTTVVDPVTGQPKHVADKKAISEGAKQAKGLNDASRPFNPYAPAIDPLIPIGTTVVGAVSAAWASFLNWRNKKALTAVVNGVEKFSAPKPPKGSLKEIIAGESEKLNIATHLDNTVQKLSNP